MTKCPICQRPNVVIEDEMICSRCWWSWTFTKGHLWWPPRRWPRMVIGIFEMALYVMLDFITFGSLSRFEVKSRSE